MRNLVTENGRRYGLLQLSLTVAFALLLVPGLAFGQAFVQIADNLPGSGTTTTFTNPETAGDFNVVIVGWDGSTSITSVTDSNGNTYVLAGTSSGQGLAQAIYYARNISVATTTTPTVTVSFVKALSDSDVRVVEYTGFSSAAVTVDNWIGNAGGNSPATSNNFATTTSSLIVGAGSAVDEFQTGGIPGGLTTRGIDVFGNVTMDSNGAVPAGTYAAGSNVLGGWVMQAAGFSLTGIATATPTVTAIAPATGGVAGGDPVTITGTNFSNGAVALFGTAPGGLALLNCVVSASTTMTCNTPPDNEGLKDLTVVNVDGKNGSLIGAFTYSINDPVITSITPAASTTNGNTTVTITGSNFEPGAQVNVGGPLPQAGNGVFGDNPTVVSPTMMTFTTPALSVGAADVEVRNPDGGNATDGGALTYALGTGAINYIQRTDAATGSSASTVPTSPMANPQTKGNTNIIVIGWGDVVAQVSSVSDSEGNTYQAALPTVNGSDTSQTIYYAKNIIGDNLSCAPNCNTITVHFSRGAASPDVRALEYSGLDPNNPLDTGMSNSGNGTTADTGVCSTTSASEVIVAGATVDSAVTAAGPGYTTVDYTFNGDNVEHQITSAIGSCEAQALLTAGNWVIQSVSFKAGAAGPSYTITPVAPTSQTVVAGSQAVYALTLAAVNGFSSAVTPSCTGLPTGATCAFAPSPVTPGTATADTLTISTTGATPVGTSAVTITGTPPPSAPATVTLTVTPAPPGFTLTANPTSATIGTAGGSASSAISVNATGGFSASVALTCAVTGGGAPAPTCSLSPASTTPGTPSTLTVNTTANSASNSPRSTGLFYALLLPIGGMTLLGAGFSSRRKMLVGILLICLMVTGFIFMTACGGGSSSTTPPPPSGGTPAGTYTVTVTGTSGSLAPTTTFTVTVQ